MTEANEVIELVAAIIGREAPADWTETYRPQVKWPGDFSELELARYRNTARAVIAALAGHQISPVAPALDPAAISDRANEERLPEPGFGPEGRS